MDVPLIREIRIFCKLRVGLKPSVDPKVSKIVPSTPGKPWIALLCVLLLAVVAGAQALHFHADGPASDDKPCPFCQVEHSVVAFVSILQLPFVLHATGYHWLPQSIGRKSPCDSITLFCRPPPASV